MKKKVLILIGVFVVIIGGVMYADYKANNYSYELSGDEIPPNGPDLPYEHVRDDIIRYYDSDMTYDIFDAYWYAYNIAPTYYEYYPLGNVVNLREKYLHDYRTINKTYRDDMVYYTYIDIDKDGTDELIFTTEDKDRNTEPLYYVDAIYKHVGESYESLISNIEGEELYLTEDNHIVYKENNKTKTFELKNGKLKKSSTDSSIKKNYDWTLLTGHKKENDKIRNEYIRIINESDDDTRFDLLRLYDENLELYIHKKDERTGKIIRYDGNSTQEIEVYAPMSDGNYLGVLIYQPMGNRLETKYIIAEEDVTNEYDSDLTSNYQVYSPYKEEVIKQYTLNKNGTWRVRGEVLLKDNHLYVRNAFADYANHHDEYVGEVQPEELTKEEVLYLLEKY